MPMKNKISRLNIRKGCGRKKKTTRVYKNDK